MTDAKASWFSQGHDLEEFFPERTYDSDKPRAPRRFYLKEGESKNIVFLDDQSFRFHEHNLWLGNTMANKTCLASVGLECPLCKAAAEQDETAISIKANPVVAYTVLHLYSEPWTSKNGKTYHFAKELLVAKEKTARIISLARKTRVAIDMENDSTVTEETATGLTHHKYSVSRSERKAPRVGDMFEHWKKITDFENVEAGGVRGLQLKDADGKETGILNPFNYEEIFAPGTIEEYQALVTEWKKITGKTTSDTGTTPSVTY